MSSTPFAFLPSPPSLCLPLPPRVRPEPPLPVRVAAGRCIQRCCHDENKTASLTPPQGPAPHRNHPCLLAYRGPLPFLLPPFGRSPPARSHRSRRKPPRPRPGAHMGTAGGAPPPRKAPRALPAARPPLLIRL
jgi:hypothetical protein